mmetsp:Transcript_26785/g.74953  ORF Transcript_26785/g.74953 Transcript_26785/m.74953 type:complete len:150 (-) Transcript_26785:916-1365(-)
MKFHSTICIQPGATASSTCKVKRRQGQRILEYSLRNLNVNLKLSPCPGKNAQEAKRTQCTTCMHMCAPQLSSEKASKLRAKRLLQLEGLRHKGVDPLSHLGRGGNVGIECHSEGGLAHITPANFLVLTSGSSFCRGEDAGERLLSGGEY